MSTSARNTPLPTSTKTFLEKLFVWLRIIIDIDKDISFHCARHTFATTVTLENGVLIESVSKMLGHTNIQTTQLYARITNQKIQKDMEDLAAKIEGKHDAPPAPSKMSKEEPFQKKSILRTMRKFKAERGLQ